jgi:hypothetical protein
MFLGDEYLPVNLLRSCHVFLFVLHFTFCLVFLHVGSRRVFRCHFVEDIFCFASDKKARGKKAVNFVSVVTMFN